MKKSFLIFTTLIIIIVAPSLLSIAAEKEELKAAPSTIKANKLSNDSINNIISAKGNVELIREGNTFYADEITYKKSTGIVEADGRVRIASKENNNFFADKTIVKDDISYGEFYDAGIIFEDGSFVYSPKILREDKNSFLLQKPYYATCPTDLNIDYDFDKIIDNTIKKNHLFSIKSKKVRLDEETNSIYFYHARFNIYGVPFFYLPYLKTARPSTEKQTGFSTPSYKNNSNFGYGVYVPYYLRISDKQNLKLAPLVYTKYWNYVLNADYHHSYRNGGYNILGSVANDKGASDKIKVSEDVTRADIGKDRKLGAYTQVVGAFELINNWIVDFDGTLVSDEFYLRDYEDDYSEYLTHFIDFQKVWNRNNLSVKALTFTEINNSDREVNKTPVVLPAINSHFEGRTYNFLNKHIALRSELDSNLTVISRNEGLEYQRLTIQPNLYNSYVKNGNVLKFETKLRGDIYSLYENYEEDDRSSIKEYNRFESRVLPQAELEWSYPVARRGKIFNTRLVMEPIAKVITAPKGNYNDDNIYPNEDSKITAISDSNLFSSNRFSGFDRVETGNRAAYGFKGGLYSDNYGNLGFLLGQAYRQDKNVNIRGFQNNLSDIVGRLSYSTKKMFDIYYRFRLDKDRHEARSHEVSSFFNFDKVNFGVEYVKLLPEFNTDTEQEQITPSIGIKLPMHLYFKASTTRDLFEKDETLSKSMSLSYNGSCVASSISMSETIPQDGSEKSQSINFSIKIQNQWL